MKVDGDRYYLDGKFKISKENVAILKGMNSNYITSTKDHDYRFLSRLLMCLFEKRELAGGCIKIDGSRNTDSKHKQLDTTKIEFVKGKIRNQKLHQNKIWSFFVHPQINEKLDSNNFIGHFYLQRSFARDQKETRND